MVPRTVDIHAPGIPPCSLFYMAWEPQGEARGTVVAMHGYSRQCRDFDFIAQALVERGYRVLAVDAPGRGGSSWFDDPGLYHPYVYGDVFAAFLKKLNLSSVHWLGASMGGLTAMAMGEKGYGGFFKSLTLVDITHKPNPAACKRVADYAVENLPVFASIEQHLDILKKNLPLGDVPDTVWRHYAEHQLRKSDQGYRFHFDPKIARLGQVQLRQTIDLTEGLAAITCPIALVAGGISDMCTAAEIADLRALKPAVAVHICLKAGHIPALADAETQDFIARFLASAA